jgi:peptide/nickel transport system permease protein
VTANRWRSAVGYGLSGLFVVLAVLGPLLAPYPEGALDLAHELEGASARHLLGTGENGVDLLSAILYGARLAGIIAFGSVALSCAIGTIVGAAGAYAGGRTDRFLMWLVDVFMAFPGLLLNAAVVALVARPGTMHLVAALAVSGWVGYARLARAQVLSLRDRDFVVAARALGASPARVVVRHLVPNVVGPIVVMATFGLGGAVLVEASLSFLGMGTGGETWGSLLDQGTAYLLRTGHVTLVAGLAITLTILGFQLAGDALRDRLDPNRG